MCLSEPCYSIAQIYFTLVQNRVLSLGSVWRIIYMATDHCLDTFSHQFCVRFQQLSRQQFCSLTSTTTPLSTRYTQSVSFCRLNLFPRRFGKVLTFSVCQKYELLSDCNSYITYFIFALLHICFSHCLRIKLQALVYDILERDADSLSWNM